MQNVYKWYRRLFAGWRERERERDREQICEHAVRGDGWDELGDWN